MKLQAVLAAVLFLASAAAAAADKDTVKAEGKIGELQAVTTGDSALRVSLEKTPPLCGNAFTYAYIGEKDDGFKSMLQLLLAARSAKATVMLVSQRDGEGHCKLVSVTVR
jgi:hypothetical protein